MRIECRYDKDEANEIGESTQSGDNNSDYGELDAPGVTYTRHRWSADDRKECIEAGIHPADALPIQRLHLSVHRYGDSRAQQAMRNQSLSLDWQSWLSRGRLRAPISLETQAGLGLEDLEIFALVTIVVARGLTLPTAQSIDVRGDRPDEVNMLTLFLPASETEQAEWLVPAVPIPYQQEQGTYVGCRKVLKSFVLPDYWHTGNLLRRVIAMKFPLWKGELLQPFANRHNGRSILRLMLSASNTLCENQLPIGDRASRVASLPLVLQACFRSASVIRRSEISC